MGRKKGRDLDKLPIAQWKTELEAFAKPRGMVLLIRNDGHHWQLKRTHYIVDWWPASCKAQLWHHPCRADTAAQLIELIRADVKAPLAEEPKAGPPWKTDQPAPQQADSDAVAQIERTLAELRRTVYQLEPTADAMEKRVAELEHQQALSMGRAIADLERGKQEPPFTKEDISGMIELAINLARYLNGASAVLKDMTERLKELEERSDGD